MDNLECLESLAELGSKLAAQRSISGACTDVLQLGMRLTGASCAEVLFRETETRQLICLAAQGAYPWCASQTGGRRLGSRLVEATLEDQLPLYVPHVAQNEALGVELPADAELRQAASVPLVVRGRALGAINFCGTRRADLGLDAVAVLTTLAGLLAPVIENLYIAERATSKEIARRQFLVRELEASEDERQRIARELHDGLGQTLTGLAVNIDGAMALLTQPGKEAAAVASLQRSRDAAAAALQDIRRVILALRPTVLDDMGLFAALETYARRVLGEAAIRLQVRSSGQPERLSPAVENVVFRVMQEAINNAARHSGAQMCRLTLSHTNSTLRAVVEDDGRGFYTDVDAEGTDHYGLKGMKERVDIIGGKLKLTSKPGSGSKVEVRLSYRERNGRENSHRDS